MTGDDYNDAMALENEARNAGIIVNAGSQYISLCADAKVRTHLVHGAEVYCAPTVEECRAWLRGVQWAEFMERQKVKRG